MKSVELKFFNIYFVNLISRYVIQPHENNLTMNSLDLKSKNTKRLISISLVLMICFISTSLYAQRNVRIGYIDTEYILENINEYSIANTQLDTKVMEWKAEIEVFWSCAHVPVVSIKKHQVQIRHAHRDLSDISMLCRQHLWEFMCLFD